MEFFKYLKLTERSHLYKNIFDKKIWWNEILLEISKNS